MSVRFRYKELDRTDKILFWIGCTIGSPILIIGFILGTIVVSVGVAFKVIGDHIA